MWQNSSVATGVAVKLLFDEYIRISLRFKLVQKSAVLPQI